MASWSETCRICSSPGYYSIFSKIPAFLHSQPQEYLNWQRPIYEMIQETTGLTITQSDGLPTNICALCISYLKHAVSFRDQTLNNTRSLRALQLLLNIKDENCTEKSNRIKHENQLLENASLENYLLLNINRAGICKVNKELFNKYWQTGLSEPPTMKEMTAQLRHFAYLFCDKKHVGKHKNAQRYKNKLPEALDQVNISSGEEEQGESATGGECLFSYEEKHFEEDDVATLKRNGVSAAETEHCYERKCRACSHRFLLDDSFNQHLELCIEYKFLLLIEELNLLLEIRRRKAISPHEYLRRVIFYLRKTCNWLAKNCDEIITIPAGNRRRVEGDGCQILKTGSANVTDANSSILATADTSMGVVKKCQRVGKHHNSRSKLEFQAADEVKTQNAEDNYNFEVMQHEIKELKPNKRKNVIDAFASLSEKLMTCLENSNDMQPNNEIVATQTQHQTEQKKTNAVLLQTDTDNSQLNFVSPPASALPRPNLLNRF